MKAINLLVNVLRKNKATLFKPTFLGYEDALMKYAYNINSVLLDHKLKYNVDNIELQAQNSDIIFMCNPNCHFIIDETMLIFDKKIFNKSLTKYVANVNSYPSPTLLVIHIPVTGVDSSAKNQYSIELTALSPHAKFTCQDC